MFWFKFEDETPSPNNLVSVSFYSWKVKASFLKGQMESLQSILVGYYSHQSKLCWLDIGLVFKPFNYLETEERKWHVVQPVLD